MKKSKSSLIFIIMYLAYTSIYLARVNLSMAGPELINLGICQKAQIGFLGSVFSCVYSVGRLFNGSISDSAPPWRMISIGLFVAGICNIGISFFPPYIGIFLMWTANAYAQSMLWSAVLCVITAVYDKNTAKKRMSFMVTSVAAGNILGIVLNTYFITTFGLKFAFLIPGLITVVLGAVVILSIRKIKNPNSEVKKSSISLFSAFKNRELVMMCAPAVFHGVMKENIGLWMAVFVVETYAVDLASSAYYILLIPTIGFIARMAYPMFFKLCKEKENSVSFLFFAVCAVFSIILCIGKCGMLVSVISLGVIYAGASVINTSMISIYPLHYINSGSSASVSGIMDFATYLGAGVSSAIYGVLIKSFGYFPMFVSWTVISILSMLVLVKIKMDRKALHIARG